MKAEPTRTKRDYDQALKRLELIFDSKPGSKEGDELNVLVTLIENYERVHQGKNAKRNCLRVKRIREFP